MGEKELFGVLGIEDDAGAGDAGGLEIGDAGGPPPEPPGPYAMRLDDWGVRRGRELAEQFPADARRPDSEAAAADFFDLAWTPAPEMNGDCSDALRHRFITNLIESQGYHNVHENTCLHEIASEVATLGYARGFIKYVETMEKEARDRKPGDRPVDPDLAAMAAGAKATAEVQAAIYELQETAEIFGTGTRDRAAAAKIFDRVRKSRRLREIIECSGRFRRVAQSKQKNKNVHGMDEMAGIEFGGEVDRILPSEFGGLTSGHELIRLDAMRVIVERQAMQYGFTSNEPVGKGPIVICIDESSSMDGDRIATAKGLALALAMIARKQGRWMAMVSYSDSKKGRYVCLPPAGDNDVKLIDWLDAFASGGTTLDVPLETLPKKYWPAMVSEGLKLGKTDMFIITDGEVNASDASVASFMAWKKAENVKVTSMIIDGEPGVMASFSDQIHTVNRIDANSDAVGSVLSV